MRLIHRLALPVILAATSGCSEGLTINYHDGGQSMTYGSATTMTSAIGRPVTVRPTVKVTDQGGRAIVGLSVSFTVVAGGGEVDGASVSTDNAGYATVGGWTLGPEPGANRLQVSSPGVGGSGIVFTAIGADVTQISEIGGNALTAMAGTATATPPTVQVFDHDGKAVSNFPVVFSVQAGGGALVSGLHLVSTVIAFTNANGIAASHAWFLGGTAGADTLTATAGSGIPLVGDPVIFSATAIPLTHTLRAHAP